jgi:hypothetical protein
MRNNNKGMRICVYFGLSKGEGEWPDYSVLTQKEKTDPRTFCDFTLDFDEGGSSVNPKVVKSCKVLYDGVSLLPAFGGDGDQYGLSLRNGEVYAHIRPIIEFELTQNVDPEDFIRLVWGSTYLLSPQNAEEPFYCEDWNGYTEVLSEDRVDEWVKHLKKHKVYSGKEFKPSELMSGINAKKLLGSVSLPEVEPL